MPESVQERTWVPASVQDGTDHDTSGSLVLAGKREVGLVKHVLASCHV